MIGPQKRGHFPKDYLILALLWLLAALSDRIWIILDRSVPAWDQAEYLTGALNYWHILQQPQWFSGAWWTNFWSLSSKIPPLTYIFTAPWLQVFGPNPDHSLLVHLSFTALLLIAVYGLGTTLFKRKVGLWAAGLCLLLPGIYQFRLQYLLDYPLTVMVALSFFSLTAWRKTGLAPTQPHTRISALGWALCFGLTLGGAILVKQTALFFLLVPLAWLGIEALSQKKWGRMAQLLGSLCLSTAIFGPWVQTNWLLMLSGSKRATIDSALAEGDPGLNTIGAWTYYGEKLPSHISWPLLLIPIVGLLLYLINKLTTLKKSTPPSLIPDYESLKWLAIFAIGGYFLSSLNINKDFRYTLPLLPSIAVFLAYCLMLYPRRWAHQIRWLTATIGLLFMLLNLWPTYNFTIDRVVDIVSPNARRHAYLGNEWPHPQIIAEIIKTEPYVRSNLGVLPSTPEINQHNLNYYGALRDFQVYARQVGTNENSVSQDVRSLSWFATKTGTQGSLRKRRKKTQQEMINLLENSPDIKLHQKWLLPDNTYLNLYHRQALPVQVYPLGKNLNQVSLDKVEFPAKKFPPGVPLPLSYTWSGPWEQLRSGLVLVTFKKEISPEKTTEIIKKQDPDKTAFNHDHGIGMGNLQPYPINPNQTKASLAVVEWISALPPADLAPGIYHLEATYLNRNTGESYLIKAPKISITIDPKAPPIKGPELDLVTQLGAMAKNLPEGLTGLIPMFDKIGIINQYDPTQDYVNQAELAFKYRANQEPNNVYYAYAYALTQVLLEKIPGSIEALTKVTQLDPKNPYAYAYLAFVNLYNWDGKAAEKALKPALELRPNQPEIQALNGVAALLQGNLIQAKQDLPAIKRIKIN